jgi:outer membrane lipoprotein carrier protein
MNTEVKCDQLDFKSDQGMIHKSDYVEIRNVANDSNQKGIQSVTSKMIKYDIYKIGLAKKSVCSVFYHVVALLICICSGFGVANGQNAKDPVAGVILKNMAARYHKLKAFSAGYTRIGENNSGKELTRDKGKVWVQGPAFRLQAAGYDICTEGKTLYTYSLATNECTVSPYEPDPSEITPQTVFDLYKNGYKYVLLSETKGKNGVTQILDLEPEDITSEITKVRLIIDKKSLDLKKWIVYERGTNMRQIFYLTAFEAIPLKAAPFFAFNKKKYPGARLIDLR